MVNRLKVWPVIFMTNVAPSSESRMATKGAAAARIVPSESRVMRPTSRMVMTSVKVRSRSDSETLVDTSYVTASDTPGGSVGCNCVTNFRTPRATSMMLPPGAMPAAIYTVGWRSHQAMSVPWLKATATWATLRAGS